MTSNCIICEPAPDVQPSLMKIISTFRVLLQVLETQALKLESENVAEIEKLNHKINEVTARSHSLEEDKVNAEKRSDHYKEKFLNAQDAIQQLHEKNIQLSGRRSQKSSEPFSEPSLKQFPFAPKHEISPDTRKIILAPDTCAQPESHEQDVTYISSDEEDFRQESKVKNKTKSPRKSPKAEQHKTPPRSVMESFFIKPKSLPKKRKLSSGTPKPCTDMDETRLECDDPMETSITLHPSELAKFDEEMDSIPPSPILSGGKDRRFGTFRGSAGSFVARSLEKENQSPLGRNMSKKFPVISIPLKKEDSSVKKVSCDLQNHRTKHEGQKQENVSPTIKELPGNTSLDELFDKTYGDLETTTVLDVTTFDTKTVKGHEESDDDLDALLLDGIDDAALNPTPIDPTSSTENQDDSPSPTPGLGHKKVFCREDSFDVLPRKQEEKNFKYQEVIRKHDERGKLDGKVCGQCEAYYSDVPEEERRELLRRVCRHKHVDAPPSTPEHFWEIGIPNTEECRRRGYFTDEKDLPPEERNNEPRLRRKKPLEPFFSKKR